MTIDTHASATGRIYGGGAPRPVIRSLPEETPVALVFDGTCQAVMMASPSDISDFALGFGLTEGLVRTPGDISAYETVTREDTIEARLWLVRDRAMALAARRRHMAGPVGCGLCGLDSLDQVQRDLPDLHHVAPRLTQADIAPATDQLRLRQHLHDMTRATHAAGFLRPGAGVILSREDIGRHNAMDKLIGALARNGIDPAEGAIVLTSRLSMDLVQKAAMVGCACLIAVSAPSLHALRLADRAGMTIVASHRGGSFDVYTRPDRILPG